MNKSGLQNRGNTCYLNTSIQCLYNLPILTEYFITNNYINDININIKKKKLKSNDILFTKEFAILIIKMSTGNLSVIDPKNVHQLLQKIDERFRGFNEQDSQESLAFILDNLHENLKYDCDIDYSGIIENELDELMVESAKSWQIEHNSTFSIIGELFFGQFINSIISLDKSDKGTIVSKKFEMFNMLNISIHGNTLYDSLSNYFKKEILDSKYLNEKTNQYIDSYRQLKIMKVPKYLIITLKRYKNNLRKSDNYISFPIDDLDLTSYSEGYDKLSCSLRLMTIGCHTGSLNNGHYFSICRFIDNKWYKYNDETVTEFNLNLNKKSLFRDSYILIYERID